MPKCKELILQRLATSSVPLATHELHILGYSENNIATRLSEMARAGVIEGTYRKGQSYKEWYVKKGQIDLLRSNGL